MAIPTKDSLLVPYSTNWNTRLNATPAAFGLTAADGLTYSSKHDAYIASYGALTEARADGTRSKSLTETKDSTKAALLAYARTLYATVQANPAVLDSNKVLLGITVRKSTNSPVPVPDTRLGMDVISTIGRTVTNNIHDSASSTKRGKPAGVAGAQVYSYVGAEYPTDPTKWQ